MARPQEKQQIKPQATVMVYGCDCGWKADKIQDVRQKYAVTVKNSQDSPALLAEHENYLKLINDSIASWQPVVAIHDEKRVVYLKEFR